MSPVWHHAILWTVEGLLSIGPSETNFSDMLIKFKYFHSRKCVWRSRLQNDAHCSQHKYANTFLICHGWNCGRQLCLQCRFVCFGYIKIIKNEAVSLTLWRMIYHVFTYVPNMPIYDFFRLTGSCLAVIFIVLNIMHFSEKSLSEYYLSIWKYVCKWNNSNCLPSYKRPMYSLRMQKLIVLLKS